MKPSRDIQGLLDVMAALRTPVTGCPWDLVQTFETIVPYTIEEAYEVADAVQRGDMHDLRDELGDLLLQVVFHARMAQEQSAFDFGGVVEAITTKMIRRHPHVFDKTQVLTPAEVKGLWAKIKAEEKAARMTLRGNNDKPKSLLSDIPHTLPGLTRAVKLQAKASTVGFDWDDAKLVLAKIREETAEIEEALDKGNPKEIADEIGDLLFAVANLARHVHADPEASLRNTNAKFERRFGFIEAELARRGTAMGDAGLSEMDELWNAAKALERAQPE
jgi:nucleoside triphosphate diphosphatase